MKDIDIIILEHFINDSTVKIYRDSDNNIIIDGNITIMSDEFDKFPVKIYKVNGDVNWHGNIGTIMNGSLSSLENFPDIVNGNVNISRNPYLRTLKYCPKIINGNLNCANCMISDISDIAQEINGEFDGSYNPINNIDVLANINIKGIITLNDTYWSQHNKNVKQINDSSVIITESNYLQNIV